MVWFNYLKNDSNISASPYVLNYSSAPLKKGVIFNEVKDPIHANDWLFVRANYHPINEIYNASVQPTTQDHSYLIVCENSSIENDATPVSTYLYEDLIYFKSAKEHPIGELINYEYNLYYGKDHLKYIKSTPYYDYTSQQNEYIYIQESQSTINYYLSNNNSERYARYSSTPSYINLYQYVVNRSTQGKYLLTFFNDGLDWIEGSTNRAEVKMSANFDGPNLKVIGALGPNKGKIRYKIVKKSQQSQTDTISTTEYIEQVVVDWTEVDCYSSSIAETSIIQIDDLDYAEYSIEIETLSESNQLSSGTNIYIKEIQFLRFFDLSLSEETINPNLSFISIGGIR
jgi:hypothetical protein